MKQIALALHHYHDAFGAFPPAYVPDEDGRPMHSWRVLILPFLEQQALYDLYRFDEPWDSPHNRSLAEFRPGVYRCPSDASADRFSTSYAMVVGPNAFSTGPEGRHVDEFSGRTRATLAVVEMAGAGIHWMEPRDWDTTAASRPRSDHPGLFHAAFADASVDVLDEAIDRDRLEAMTRIDGGEAIDDDKVLGFGN